MQPVSTIDRKHNSKRRQLPVPKAVLVALGCVILSCQVPQPEPVQEARQVLIAPASVSTPTKALTGTSEVRHAPAQTASSTRDQGTSGTIVKPPEKAPENAGNAPQEISAKELKSFRRIRKDPEPEQIAGNTHFIISNEIHHELFKAPIENLGGIYVGVGTDQNYVLAGWSKPLYLVMMDFDQWVVDLHRVYFHFFRTTKTPKEFIEAWSRRGLRKKKRALRKRSNALRVAFIRCRWKVYRRLRQLAKRYTQLDVPTFLNDQKQFDFLRNLVLKRRVKAVRGDLAGNFTMRSIGRFAKRYNRVVRTFYISNAEEYVGYYWAFRRNFRVLKTDEKSLLLRTLPYGDVRGRYWTYYTQKMSDFKEWLKYSKIRQVRRLVGKKRRAYDDLFELKHRPKKRKKKKKKKKRRRKKK